MSDLENDANKVAVEWQAAYTAANGKPPPCIQVRHTWIKIGGEWLPASDVAQRTERLRKMVEDR